MQLQPTITASANSLNATSMLTVPKLQIQHIQRTRNTVIEIDFSFRSKVSTLSSASEHHFLKYKQCNNKTHKRDTQSKDCT